MAKHTAGSWQAVPYDDYDEYSINAMDRMVARTNGHHLDPGEHEANACLIAAAPELLEALKSIANYLQDCDYEEDEHPLSTALAAIAKAEGAK